MLSQTSKQMLKQKKKKKRRKIKVNRKKTKINLIIYQIMLHNYRNPVIYITDMLPDKRYMLVSLLKKTFPVSSRYKQP